MTSTDSRFTHTMNCTYDLNYISDVSHFILKPPRFDYTMANLHAEFRLILTENGIPDTSPLLDYLDWAGIRTKNSLPMFFADTDKITEWTEKFQNEITFGTPETKIHFPENDRRKGLQACFIAAWHICRDDFDAARQSKLPTPTPLPLTSTPATTPSSTDDKIPKTWPKGVYQQLLTDYKTSTGNTKSFPEKILIGAEKVIVRMWHEHARTYYIQKLSGRRPRRNHHQPHIHRHWCSQQHSQTGQIRQNPCPRHRTQHPGTPRTERLGPPIHDDDPGLPRRDPLGLDPYPDLHPRDHRQLH